MFDPRPIRPAISQFPTIAVTPDAGDDALRASCEAGFANDGKFRSLGVRVNPSKISCSDKNILYRCTSNASTFYRGLLPLRLLSEIKVSYNNGVVRGASQFSSINAASCEDVLGADIIFSARSANQQTTQFLAQAKASGKKIWVDYDDDFFFVEKNDPYYGVLMSVRQSLIDQLVVADLVTVSTDHLRATVE